MDGTRLAPVVSTRKRHGAACKARLDYVCVMRLLGLFTRSHH